MLNFDEIQFKNPAQKRFYKTISSKDITFGIGPAGCGKTYLSVHKALRELGDKDSTIDGIVIVKPLVEAAGEKIGFLPGDVEEKTAPFMMSFYYNMEQIIGKQRLKILKESGVIEVIPLACQSEKSSSIYFFDFFYQNIWKSSQKIFDQITHHSFFAS